MGMAKGNTLPFHVFLEKSQRIEGIIRHSNFIHLRLRRESAIFSSSLKSDLWQDRSRSKAQPLAWVGSFFFSFFLFLILSAIFQRWFRWLVLCQMWSSRLKGEQLSKEICFFFFFKCCKRKEKRITAKEGVTWKLWRQWKFSLCNLTHWSWKKRGCLPCIIGSAGLLG